MAIVTALRLMRNFKRTKTAHQDIVIELAAAIQRCTTVLNCLGASRELTNDRETMAATIHCLPTAAKDRWFQREALDNETPVEQCLRFIDWLEKERNNAVRVHLNKMIRRMQVSAPSPASGQTVEVGPALSRDFRLALSSPRKPTHCLTSSRLQQVLPC